MLNLDRSYFKSFHQVYGDII